MTIQSSVISPLYKSLTNIFPLRKGDPESFKKRKLNIIVLGRDEYHRTVFRKPGKGSNFREFVNLKLKTVSPYHEHDFVYKAADDDLEVYFWSNVRVTELLNAARNKLGYNPVYVVLPDVELHRVAEQDNYINNKVIKRFSEYAIEYQNWGDDGLLQSCLVKGQGHENIISILQRNSTNQATQVEISEDDFDVLNVSAPPKRWWLLLSLRELSFWGFLVKGVFLLLLFVMVFQGSSYFQLQHHQDDILQRTAVMEADADYWLGLKSQMESASDKAENISNVYQKLLLTDMLQIVAGVLSQRPEATLRSFEFEESDIVKLEISDTPDSQTFFVNVMESNPQIERVLISQFDNNRLTLELQLAVSE